MFSKTIKILCIVAGLLVTLVFALLLYLYVSTRNVVTGTLALPGLKHQVVVTRDQYGVPHIKAENDEDAFFALGYVHAQDRFWQMEFQRHIFQGTLSEVFGAATIEQDKFLRTLGFYRSAQQAWQALSPQAKSIIHSYTNGINSFLRSANLPLQLKILRYDPKPWLDVDSIAWQKLMAWDLQNTWQEKVENYFILRELGADQREIILPPYPKQSLTILGHDDIAHTGLAEKHKDDIEVLQLQSLVKAAQIVDTLNATLNMKNVPGKGSNNWVVSGRLTASHKPILASDPHLSFSAPNLWYLADIETPHFHVIGATIPGLPAMIIGHNDYIAWGMTNACVDAQDLYLEDEKTTVYKIIPEKISVKGGPDTVLNVRESVHGPIISDVTSAGKMGQAVALKWPALMPDDTTIQSFIELSYVQNWQQFQRTLSHYISPSQNFIYADKAGNIGYYLTGKIPVRDGWSGALPADGSKHHEWLGYIPFANLPHVYNPEKGYIVTANNQITTDNYPYQLTNRCGTAPYRAERIDEMIRQKTNLTPADMARIQNDTTSLLWRDLGNVLLKTKPLDNDSTLALQQLAAWNGEMDKNSVEATLFASWFIHLSDMIPVKIKEFSEWTSPLFIKQQLESDGSYCRTGGAKNCQEFLSASLQRSVANNNSHQQWGRVHHAIFNDLGLGSVAYLGKLWQRDIATGGDAFTVNVGTYDFKNFNQIAGAGYRQIVDMNNFDNSLYVQALGQSNDVFNAHYDDQMSLWQSGQYLSMNSASAIKKDVLILMPL